MKTIISDKAVQYISECFDSAYDTSISVCNPLLMDGEGMFFVKNGNRMHSADVLAEHRKMEKALRLIKDKLDIVKSQMERVEE